MVLRTKGVLLALLGVGGSMGGRGVSPGRAKRKANTFLPSPCHLVQSSLPELELFIEHDQTLPWVPWLGDGHQVVGRWHVQVQCPKDTLSSPLPCALGVASLTSLPTPPTG